MTYATKLRLLSMRNDLKADVAHLILENTIDSHSDLDIARYMNDVLNNGCAYMNIFGLRYHEEIIEFYNKHQHEIDLKVWLFETSRNGKTIEVFGDKRSKYAWFAFEQTVAEMMTNFAKR